MCRAVFVVFLSMAVFVVVFCVAVIVFESTSSSCVGVIVIVTVIVTADFAVAVDVDVVIAIVSVLVHRRCRPWCRCRFFVVDADVVDVADLVCRRVCSMSMSSMSSFLMGVVLFFDTVY